MIDFCGVYKNPSSASPIKCLGAEPAWSDERIAFGGAPVWTDSTRTIVVSGDVTLDNAPELRLELELPNLNCGELLAELYRVYGMEVGCHALGMYAVAIWDKRNHKLVLLRDGVGGGG